MRGHVYPRWKRLVKKEPSVDYKKNIVNTFIHYSTIADDKIHFDDWIINYNLKGYTNKLKKKRKEKGDSMKQALKALEGRLRTFCIRCCSQYNVNEKGPMGDLLKECIYKHYLNFKERASGHMIKMHIGAKERRTLILRTFEKIIDDIGESAPLTWKREYRKRESYTRLFKSGNTIGTFNDYYAKSKPIQVIEDGKSSSKNVIFLASDIETTK